MEASNEFLHPNPRTSYIDGPESGRNAPARDWETVFATIGEETYLVQASTG